MLGLLGDLHADFGIMTDLIPKLKNVPITVIQVGDFGYYPDTHRGTVLSGTPLDYWPETEFPVYWIDGNHSWHPFLRGITEVTELKKNLFYVPRGSVLDLEGYRIGFMGGAESIDKFYQMKRGTWFSAESITQAQISLLWDRTDLDMLITHTAPTSIIRAHFPPLDLQEWGLPATWQDTSSQLVENLWNKLDNIPLFCGHFHKHIIDRACRILDINEFYTMDSKE